MKKPALFNASSTRHSPDRKTSWLARSRLLRGLLVGFCLLLMLFSTGILDRMIRGIQRDNGLFPSCLTVARRSQQPYSIGYKTRNQTVDPDGSVFAFYEWQGEISAEDFEKTMKLELPSTTLKIWNGEFYEKATWTSKEPSTESIRLNFLLLVQMTLYLYQIPNLDFTFFINDETPCGLPVLAHNVNTQCDGHSGFTVPSKGIFSQALGYHQISKYQQCLNSRYPLHDSINKAVWRGSSTGLRIVNLQYYHQLYRVQLAKLGRQNPDLFDVGLTAYVQMDKETRKRLENEVPLVQSLRFDNFNRYGVILDLDGNAWSDRFGALLFSNRPILKQESPWKEYFRIPMAPSLVTLFDRNLTNLIHLTSNLLAKYKSEIGIQEIEEEIELRRRFAWDHVSQLGVLRAMAYTLVKYHQKQSWQVDFEENYTKVTSTMLLIDHSTFPAGFVEDVKKEITD